MDSWRKWSIWLAFHFNERSKQSQIWQSWALDFFVVVLFCSGLTWDFLQCLDVFEWTLPAFSVLIKLGWHGKKSVILGEGASASRASSCNQVVIFLWTSSVSQIVGGFCYGSSLIKRIIVRFKGYIFTWYQTAAGPMWIYTWGEPSQHVGLHFTGNSHFTLFRFTLFRFYLKNLFFPLNLQCGFLHESMTINSSVVPLPYLGNLV